MRTIFCLAIAVVVSVVSIPLAHAVDVMPAWDNQINRPERFVVLKDFNNEAVFDKETGLVWEQSLPTFTLDWENAQARCTILNKGGRLGWRLPTIQELASLVDPSVLPANPTLPAGHPFSNVQSGFYWSATGTVFHFPDFVWVVDFSGTALARTAKTNSLFIWCVRGGSGVDPQ